MEWPVVGHFSLKKGTTRNSKISEIQPTLMQCHHPEAGATSVEDLCLLYRTYLTQLQFSIEIKI
jgi:hypothetical protein